MKLIEIAMIYLNLMSMKTSWKSNSFKNNQIMVHARIYPHWKLKNYTNYNPAFNWIANKELL